MYARNDFEKMRAAVKPRKADAKPADFGMTNNFAFVPSKQGVVQGIGGNKPNKGKDVTIGKIKRRCDHVQDFLHDETLDGDGYAEIYSYRAYQIIFAVLAIATSFYSVYAAAVFAVLFGYYTGNWCWTHFLSVQNNKARSIMHTI
ncbi:hypothetical protein HY993_00405 [Candidatus Micrarchaeota archaeon]|nr:hypothetical protein [Candidatus Micrarchaeota archaeon]